jgi:hypothetical protein
MHKPSAAAFAVIVACAAFAAAGCGGGSKPATTDYSTTFHNKTAVETAIANYLHVERVSCVKKSATTTECTAPDRTVYLVLCKTADVIGGPGCTISRKNEDPVSGRLNL